MSRVPAWAAVLLAEMTALSSCSLILLAVSSNSRELFEEALALENGCPFHADQDLVAASCRLFGENGKRGPVVPGHDRCTCRRRLEGIVLEARAAAARDQEAKNGESRSLRYLHVVPTPSPRKKPPFRGSPEAPGKRRPVQNAIPRPAMTPRRLWYPTPILNHSIT